MSVNITIGEEGRERRYEVAPFKLRELRLAAPSIERMNATAKRIDADQKAAVAAGLKPEDGVKLEDLFELSRCLCEIVAVGLAKIDPSMTADVLEEEIDITYVQSLQAAVRALLAQSGLSSAGEVKAPSPSRKTTGPKASQRSSEELSAS